MLIFRAFNFILYDILCVLYFLMCVCSLSLLLCMFVLYVIVSLPVGVIKDDDDDNDDKMWPTVTDVGHTG